MLAVALNKAFNEWHNVHINLCCVNRNAQHVKLQNTNRYLWRTLSWHAALRIWPEDPAGLWIESMKVCDVHIDNDFAIGGDTNGLPLDAQVLCRLIQLVTLAMAIELLSIWTPLKKQLRPPKADLCVCG